MQGLSRLEYRGYDSAGFACIRPHDNHLIYTKAQGGVANLVKNFELSPIDGHLGVGHTRWSTHGVATAENAHPHFDCHKLISVVHNGIIENHAQLREELEVAGHVFSSQTDTETIAHLIETLLHGNKKLETVAAEAVNRLQGAFAFIALMQQYPDVMLVVRKRSPLALGFGDDEMFIASDILAFAGKTNKILFMPDESFALVHKTGVQLFSFSGKILPLHIQVMDINFAADGKRGHEHYMLKEIYEQKRVIHDTISHYSNNKLDEIWKMMGVTPKKIQELKRMEFIACGTSYHAARIGQFFFEMIAHVRTKATLASEFRYQPYFPEKKSFTIAISQSGETADTLEAVRMVNGFKGHVIALTNVASSTIVRETKGYLPTYAGPEIAVASTKAFSSQVAVLYWLAHAIAREKGLITEAQLKHVEDELVIVAEILEHGIETYKKQIIDVIAPRYAQAKHAFFLGRHISYPMAMEASLKLQEISYIFSTCYPAGELKHGPLALIDEHTPVFMFSSLDPVVYQKLVGNAQEIKARNGHLVVFAFEDQKELMALADCSFILPRVNPLLVPLAVTGLMQFFVYQLARVLQRPIDKPRNLAKSVTVE
jgi:glucosamine--fructose-6-phosphate aminotransferase (isomerizing)